MEISLKNMINFREFLIIKKWTRRYKIKGNV